MLLGARDLGLTTEWRFGFAPFGFHAETTPGAVYLDVGGGLRPGVLDHHSDPGCESSASLVLDHREAVYNHLLGPWLERFPEGRVPEGTTWRPTIVTHRNPDWDGMAAAWLVMRLVEDGDFPAWAPALAAYSLDVDQGRCRIDPKEESSDLAPHVGYLALQNMAPSGSELPNEGCLRKGFRLLEAAVDGIVKATKSGPRNKAAFQPPAPGAAAWADLPEFAEIRAFLKDERRKFEEDRKHRDGAYLNVRLPDRAGGTPLEVPAWVARRPTLSALNKYWVRSDADGAPLFVCPYVREGHAGEVPEGPEAVFPRVVISVDPEWKSPDGRRPDLRGFGYALEKAETETRREDGTSSERAGSPRFPNGYCDNKDPWYDGRGQEWTIVDAPACGSRLKYGELLRVLTEESWWETPLDQANLVLIWTDAPASSAHGAGKAIGAFEGMSETLKPYVAGTSDFQAGPIVEGDKGCIEVCVTMRRFPKGTCQPMTVVTLKATPGATMEGLHARHGALVAAMRRPPDYSYGRVCFAPHFESSGRRDVLLRPLADGDVRQLEELRSEDEVVFFNGRSLLIHGSPGAAGRETARADLEVLLYAAFLNETLVALSGEVSRQLGSGETVLPAGDSRNLLTRMLVFQTRYYQLEASRLPRGRTLFNRLFEELRLSAHYTEVQAELDRLSAVEANEADQRADRASKVLEFFLALLAVAGVFQTVIAFFTLPSDTSARPSFWWSVGTVTVLSAAVIVGVNLYRQKARGAAPASRDREGKQP